MPVLVPKNKVHKRLFIAACVIMLSLAFYQCYKTTCDLNWAPDPDFDRDVSFVRGALSGNFGKDPNYVGEYLWYNPLLFSVEAAIVKLTLLPAHEVAVRAGAYLNIFAPITFFIMAVSLLGFEVALAALLSFLFLANGNILGWGGATYSPRLYPVCFTQFIFYINVWLCYKAFSTRKNFWFILLGTVTGISFLGHAAPALIMILMMFSLQMPNIFSSIKEREFKLLRKYVLQGIWAFAFFIIAAMPLLYFVLGKYHMHFSNRNLFEYTEGIFYLSNYKGLIKADLSISFIISIIGLIWFYKNFKHALIRKIIFSWLLISAAMYVYSTLVSFLDSRYHIQLPGSVPSFHYFFYLKAAQSIFFGFGFVFLITEFYQFIRKIFSTKINMPENFSSMVFVSVVLLWAFIYFPVYSHRPDFTMFRAEALQKTNKKYEIEVHDYILQHIPEDKVILCEKDPSLFPVMATGRKMVSVAYTFSNPYIDFKKRENARNDMLLFLKTGMPDVKKLFSEYDVSYALISAQELSGYKSLPSIFGETVFKNDGFTLFKINK